MQNFDYQFGMPILGIDEAGRGPLCGPVVSCCVWWKKYPETTLEIDDSKKLTHEKRLSIFNQLIQLRDEGYIEWAIGVVSAYQIDEINIFQATKLSMQQAFRRCIKPITPYKILVDGNHKMLLEDCFPVIKGDQLSFTIATASIIAKVTRDHIMEKIHLLYPDYHLAQHKGYGTLLHRTQIKTFGHSPYHRKTFKY
jgi:ribonuclease HII